MDLSLSLALVVTISKESWREIAQREKPKEKCALGKRDHTRSKKNYILVGLYIFFPMRTRWRECVCAHPRSRLALNRRKSRVFSFLLRRPSRGSKKRDVHALKSDEVK